MIRRICGWFIAAAVTLSVHPAEAVTYIYTGTPQDAFFGTALQGAQLSFSFTTPNYLPANLTDATAAELYLISPFFSVPVESWSASIGSYTIDVTQQPIVPGLLFVAFNTDSIGDITGWLIQFDSLNTDGTEQISASSVGLSRITGGQSTVLSMTIPR
jgi:hypothetical protein